MLSLVVQPKQRNTILVLLLLQFFLVYSNYVEGQQNINPTTNKTGSTRFSTKGNTDLFNTNKCFIKNVGQYVDSNAGYKNMSEIRYGFEGFTMPVLFTDKGLVYLQRELKKAPHKEREERGKETVEEEMERRTYINRYITMEWLNADPHPIIEAENELTAYHTYGLIQEKAKSYKKLIYKDIYPGVDIVYNFNENTTIGFEYSIIVKPGADLNQVHFKYGGNIHSIKKDKSGSLVISSDIEGIKETVPVTFYQENEGPAFIKEDSTLRNPKIQLAKKENEIHFTGNYDHHRTLIIDPFVSSTNNLTGVLAKKAADIDFDFAGNIFIAGGGNRLIQQLAKFDANGVLQWTFSGVSGSWNFGQSRGGWIVEKSSGKIYLAQGFQGTGYQVIRLNPAGIYDNYISDANSNFEEAWKLYWTCNNGAPQLMIAGGGTTSNNNFGILSPPSTSITALNITGLPTICQDIVDIIIDPVTNEMFTLFPTNSPLTMIENMIYKNRVPYSSSSVAWGLPTGIDVMSELDNRPYFGSSSDNSANVIAINNSNLFYWDGKNLKAFDKATGASVGAPVTTANTVLMQGGIIADACNNVFIGEANGTIKVYHFDGSIFDDPAEPDITIPGFSGHSVYDLAYDESKKLLYACGDGFVASFDISSYCASSQFTLNLNADCNTGIETTTLAPAPPFGTIVNYSLYQAGIPIQNNFTGVFTSIQTGINYKIIASLNQTCGGIQVSKDFILPAPAFDASKTTITNSTCGNNNGSLNVTATGSTPPYLYSIDGTTYQASGIFNSLATGNYALIAKDANGCIATMPISINVTAPTIQIAKTDPSCGSNNGLITATAGGGLAPYLYSIDNINWSANNNFNNLVPGNYTISIKDAAGCSSTQSIQLVNNSGNINLSSGGDLNICSGTSTVLAATSNGTSFTWTPATGLSNATILNPLASPSTTTKYYITASDGICNLQDSVTVIVNPSPIANAGLDKTVCFEETTELIGNGGGSYTWTPNTFLTNNKSANPIVEKPTSTITYSLTVVNGFGCQSLNKSTATINVLPEAKVFAGDDVVIIRNQSVQLHAKDITNSQFTGFVWSPSSGLDNYTSQNPVVTTNKDITYELTAVTKDGCLVTDQVNIKVVEKPQIYIPTGFTPNGDGKDDFLKALPVGIKEFKFLSIYNRWGHRIFYTTDPAKGWDGTINGETQNTDVFIWIAEGIDYNGNTIVKKGTTVLIR